jgi:hypothetical protein
VGHATPAGDDDFGQRRGLDEKLRLGDAYNNEFVEADTEPQDRVLE